MSGLYWLIFLIAAIPVSIYARHWYYLPSGMSDVVEASYSYQVLKYIDFYARRQERDPERDPIPMYGVVEPYMKDRRLTWRKRRDIIGHMLARDWIYRDPQNANMFVMAEAGTRELETAYGLRRAVEETARTLHDCGISSDQAKAEAAAAIAAALRVGARDAPPESRQQAEGAATEIEEAVRAGDPDKIDRVITRTRDVLQIAAYTLPFVRDILRVLGLS